MDEKKTNLKIIAVGVAFLLVLAFGIYSGITANRYRNSLRKAESDLRGVNEKLSASSLEIERLRSSNLVLETAIKRWGERDTRLDGIREAIEAGNRREEEVYRALAAGIGRIEGGLSVIKTSVGSIEVANSGIREALSGSVALIEEGTAIIRGLQGGGGTTDKKP